MKHRNKKSYLIRRWRKYATRIFVAFVIIIFFSSSIYGIREIYYDFFCEDRNENNIICEVTSQHIPIRHKRKKKMDHIGKQEKLNTNPKQKQACLVLVNKNSPLKQDYQVDLHLLKNGEYVAEVMYEDLRDMLFTGEKENPGISFVVASGYRSKERQKQLVADEIKKNEKSGMTREDAERDALETVAPAGCSEHETGLCVDIVAETNQRMDETQQYTKENIWLKEHCSDYGFILRYPLGKESITGYSFESWHFRYVGKGAAKEIKEKGITLEEYLDSSKVIP